VDVCLVIKQRLELGLEQRDLAAAAEVTEILHSQLLNRTKSPPEPSRTDIYDKIGKFRLGGRRTTTGKQIPTHDSTTNATGVANLR
jgi:hypothetical protein